MKHIKCNVCGYITTEGSVKDVCPACGVPAQSFEPYVSPLSGKRQALLSLYLHPIAVHFPIALVFLAVLFDIAALLFTGAIYTFLLCGVQVTTVLLPIFVLIAALVGLLDGKTRFKRLTTKKIRFKMVTALIFFAIALTNALVALLVPVSTGALVVMLILACASLVTSVLLSNVGARLRCIAMPG